MIDSLWEKYQCLGPSYYEIPIEKDNIFRFDFSPWACRNFIEEHYIKGNKKKALEFIFNDEYRDNGKHQHTVALYLLGLHLKCLFDGRIKDKIHELMPVDDESDSWYDYRYTWFLTSLYHDVASCIESFPKVRNLIAQQKTLDFYLREFNIKYTPFNYTPTHSDVSLTRFSETLVKNYFYYRMDDNSSGHKCDHGIIGGYMLFDKLYRNFKDKTRDVSWKPNHREENIHGLRYRPEHLDHFAYIADAIICHNMWTANEPARIETYREYGLEPLIIDETNQNRKLNIDDYPLQFLLCLLDSIEPVKRYTGEKADLNDDWDAKKVLDSFSVDPSENENEIRISWCENAEKAKEFTKWADSVNDLSKWMDVSVQPKEIKPGGDRHITIKIGPKSICKLTDGGADPISKTYPL